MDFGTRRSLSRTTSPWVGPPGVDESFEFQAGGDHVLEAGVPVFVQRSVGSYGTIPVATTMVPTRKVDLLVPGMS